MPICSTNIKILLLPGLRKTPDERALAKAEAERIMEAKAAEEQAYYQSLAAEDRADYDRMTEGMMPRLRR